LSSAILYVAIVAIWAGVLIPRWLRRDTSAVEREDDEAGAADTETVPSPSARETVPRTREDATPVASSASGTSGASSASAERPAQGPAARQAAAHAPRQAPASRQAPAAGAQDRRPELAAAGEDDSAGKPSEERKKVLAARRRLLGMLVVLALASCTLAVTKMAAWWVIVPPFVMLTGYLGLLREASKADAERRELARARVAEAAARRDARPVAPSAAAPVAPPVAPPASAPGTRAAPQVPAAEIIDISASLGAGGEEIYDQYADAKLRAVGDLLIPGPRSAPVERQARACPSDCRASRVRRVASVTSGAGVDEEGLGAAEGDVGVEGEVLAGNQAQGGIAACEFGDGDLGFQFAQVGA